MMYENEAALLDGIPALQADAELRAAVEAVVDEILTMRRTTLMELVHNPLQRAALAAEGVKKLEEEMKDAGLDPEKKVEGAEATVAEALSDTNAGTVLGAVSAHLMELMAVDGPPAGDGGSAPDGG